MEAKDNSVKACQLETWGTIASPCQADWSKMTGDDSVRTCSQCKSQVVNLVQLTRADAKQLIESSTGDLCVRAQVRSDGTVITKDYDDGFDMRPTLLSLVTMMIALLLTPLGIFWARRSEHTQVNPRYDSWLWPTSTPNSSFVFMGTVSPRIVIPEEEEVKLEDTSNPFAE